jgi:predicted nucleic acid-binding protein
MQVFDASSMIYAWDNYPVRQFPGLWDWMAAQIEEKRLAMATVAFEEVEHKAPECGEWLKENNLERLPISNAILLDALRIKGLLGIAGDNYHAKGVGENDILIIATTRDQGAELVSDEGKQTVLPLELSKCRIPAVCGMAGVSVTCINFIEYVKRSEVVFR